MSSDTRWKNLTLWIKEFDSEAAFAKAAGIAPAFLWQLKNRDRNIGEKLARKMERNLGVPDGAMDQLDDRYKPVPPPDPNLPDSPLVIPRLAAEGSMGNGISATLEHDEAIDSFETTRKWVKSRLSHATSIQNIRIITGLGDSMKGTFNHGDALFVDTGINEVKIDAVYALAYEDELFIKRVQRIPGGRLKLISDNKQGGYEPILIDHKDVKDFRVIGRVIGALNYNEL